MKGDSAAATAPRIALFLPDLRPGGAERMRVRLANALNQRGYRVQLVLRQKRGALLEDVAAGVDIVDLDAPRVRHAFGALRRYLRREAPDVLLTAMWPLTAISILATRLLPVRPRVVISEHTTLSSAHVDSPWWRWLIVRLSVRLAYPMADAVIAVSRGVADDLAALSGISVSRIAVIQNPVVMHDSIDGFAPVRRAAGSPARFIAVGSLKPAKDYPTLLRAFATLLAQSPATLRILGAGPLLGTLQEQALQLGISDKVHFSGHVDDPRTALREADVFVLSSRWEGFPNVVVEALECGLPVVATDCRSGPREILADGAYGELVPVGDAAALAAAMQRALSAPPDSARQRARAREFGVDAAVDRYVRVLDVAP